MSWLPDDIEDVRACVLPETTNIDGNCVAVSRALLVTWRSCLQSRLFQVYVNGRLSGQTRNPYQRRLIVEIPWSFGSVARVVVVSVEPRDIDVDFGTEIEWALAGTTRVKLTLLRGQDLPWEGTVNIYYDQGLGQVDFSEPLNESPIPLWSDWHDKAGFGLAQFGHGDHGYESAGVMGFGSGNFGHSAFGTEAGVFEWISPDLPLGRYRFGIVISDAHGNESLITETDAVAVVPGAKPVAQLSIAGFDQPARRLTLSPSD